jgi:hypothetical protein
MHASADSRPGGGPGRTWRARAVFLSSTFADMHAECDDLRLQAWSTYRRAFTHFRVLADAQPRDAQACRDLVIAHVRLARAAMMAGRPADVQAHQQEFHQLLVRMQADGLWLDAASECAARGARSRRGRLCHDRGATLEARDGAEG